ncbi:MAG TPA: DMT family transporter [Bacteroidales bacterium]|nr:DMT family transporter [Bacteroidales bacterium]HPF01826.1 DMT family transporter [Bacteroidales bacterium]HPJ59902.1 DMT family transporter [Bacteroidales bacterium]HPR11347.1 DMT family transporter [Bacteroidales bacterium]HRW85720.1 DMT family transporter [Bacteroidales bacterium]
MSRLHKSYVYALLAVFFWSTIPTAFKISLRELDVLPMLTIASLTSATVLLVIIIAGNKTHLLVMNSARELISSALLGLINPALYYIILLNAYKLLPAQIAQPLNMIWPIILVFLSVPLLKQKIKARSYVALLISFAGVYVISSQGNLFSRGQADIKGVLLATGSSVFWALYFILNVRDKRDEAVKLFLNFLFGSLYLVIALLFSHKWQITGPAVKGMTAAIYVGVFEMGIAFLFWLKALQTAETSDRISNLVYLAPFLSLVFIHFILHEPVYYTTPAGLVLIIAGIWLQNRRTATV